MKRLVRAAYESDHRRKRYFQIKKPGSAGHVGKFQSLTWEGVVRVWERDQQNPTTRRTKLRKEHVFRDGFSDLRVGVAMAAFTPAVLAAMKLDATELATSSPADRVLADDVLEMRTYLSNLSKCFHKLFLDNKTIKFRGVCDLQKARDLYQYLR